MKLHVHYCTTCDIMAPADDVHSCYDAARLTQHREAERAVVEAAKAWLDVGGGSLVELVFAVKNLRKLEAEV